MTSTETASPALEETPADRLARMCVEAESWSDRYLASQSGQLARIERLAKPGLYRYELGFVVLSERVRRLRAEAGPGPYDPQRDEALIVGVQELEAQR
jgi:hypothetical protein